jgi:serine/threonine protein kinase
MTDIRKAFFKAAAPRKKDRDILEVILQERPDLRKERPFCANNGNFGYAFIFNNEVFKAPKDLDYRSDDEIVENFQKEIKIQQALAAQNFPVPQITYAGKKAFFFGMQKINGLSLKDALSGVYVKLSERQRKYIILGIASFKAKLEKADLGAILPSEDAFALSPGDLLLAREGLSTPVVQKILTEQAPDFLPALQKFLDDYPSRQPGIIHGDLHGGNILFNPKTGKISGFLDFERVKRTIITDAEFLHLQESYDPAFALAVQSAYQNITGKDVQAGSYLCLKALDMLAARTAFARRENAEEAEQELKSTAQCLVSKHHYGAYRTALRQPFL